MSSKVKWVIILLISLVMTALTLLFLQKYLSEETQRRIAQAEPDGTAVVVFARSLPPDQQVFAEHLAVREFPENLVSEQWLQQHQISELIGQRLKYAVEQGEPLTRAMLITEQLSGLSRQIPKNHYAVTLAATEVARHNGLLAVGDKVDLVFHQQTLTGEVIQHSFTDLTVFDLGGSNGNYATATGGITLLVPSTRIAAFTRYQKDNYSLWVRPTGMVAEAQQWRPVAPTSKVLEWQGGR